MLSTELGSQLLHPWVNIALTLDMLKEPIMKVNHLLSLIFFMKLTLIQKQCLESLMYLRLLMCKTQMFSLVGTGQVSSHGVLKGMY